MVTNTSMLIGDVKIEGSLDCSDHTLVEFTLLSDMGKARSTLRALNFRKAKFQLFKELVSRMPWSSKTGGQKRAGRSLRTLFHRVQELSVPRCKKSGKDGKRPSWLS